ncbi:MAG: 30S ribosomal protein S18 [Dehalococcoidia bacterium]|nr:30S ribosomal protein S18 [Dehalococcoidia bacterium]
MTSYSGHQSSGGSRGGSGPRSGGAGGAGGTGPRKFFRGRKACTFCVEHIDTVDYKSVNRLRRFMSDRARMESGKRTGTCARHQRMVRTAIKRARIMGMLPFSPDHLRVTGPVSTGGPRGTGPAAAAAEQAEVEAIGAEVDSGFAEEDVAQDEDGGEEERTA